MSRAAHQLVTAAAHTPWLAPIGVIGDGVTFPSTASFSMNFFEAGFLRVDNTLANTLFPTQWANQTLGSVAIAAPYEIRLTVTSGASPSSGDTVGAWLSMVGGSGGKRSWGLSRSSLGASVGTWLVEIRAASSTQVLTSNSYTVTASVSSP